MQDQFEIYLITHISCYCICLLYIDFYHIFPGNSTFSEHVGYCMSFNSTAPETICCINFYSMGIIFRRQNLTYLDVTFLRLKCKSKNIYNGCKPLTQLFKGIRKS